MFDTSNEVYLGDPCKNLIFFLGINEIFWLIF